MYNNHPIDCCIVCGSWVLLMLLFVCVQHKPCCMGNNMQAKLREKHCTTAHSTKLIVLSDTPDKRYQCTLRDQDTPSTKFIIYSFWFGRTGYTRRLTSLWVTRPESVALIVPLMTLIKASSWWYFIFMCQSGHSLNINLINIWILLAGVWYFDGILSGFLYFFFIEFWVFLWKDFGFFFLRDGVECDELGESFVLRISKLEKTVEF